MKIRSDFVTNSSSSSFIIGKKDDEAVTIESVYQLIREFYIEFHDKVDDLKRFLHDNPDFGLYFENDTFKLFDTYRPDVTDHKSRIIMRRDLKNIVEKMFGVPLWDIRGRPEWLELDTYEKYKQYFLYSHTIKNESGAYIHAPFTIADFLEEKEIDMLHCGNHKEIHYINEKSEVLQWYFPYVEKILIGVPCHNCIFSEWCDKKECEEIKEYILNNNVLREKACLYMLGRVCIHSECGYIPDYVVKKLSEVSEFSCNHMG